MRIVSLDIPWGGETYVGAAAAELRDGQLAGPPMVTSMHSGQAPASHSPLPPLPVTHPEVARFIADGAGPGRSRATDTAGPFNAFPHTPAARDAPGRLRLCHDLLDAIATHRVADRPDRYEPRVKKRRRNHYGWLTEPRGDLKRKMAKGVIKK
jgi:hypothetical protein